MSTPKYLLLLLICLTIYQCTSRSLPEITTFKVDTIKTYNCPVEESDLYLRFSKLNNKNKLWVTTPYEGKELDLATGTWQSFNTKFGLPKDKFGPLDISDLVVDSVTQDVYVKCFHRNIVRYNSKTQKVTEIPLRAKGIYPFEDVVLLAADGGGLYSLDKKTLKLNRKSIVLDSINIHAIVAGGSNEFLINEGIYTSTNRSSWKYPPVYVYNMRKNTLEKQKQKKGRPQMLKRIEHIGGTIRVVKDNPYQTTWYRGQDLLLCRKNSRGTLMQFNKLPNSKKGKVPESLAEDANHIYFHYDKKIYVCNKDYVFQNAIPFDIEKNANQRKSKSIARGNNQKSVEALDFEIMQPLQTTETIDSILKTQNRDLGTYNHITDRLLPEKLEAALATNKALKEHAISYVAEENNSLVTDFYNRHLSEYYLKKMEFDKAFDYYEKWPASEWERKKSYGYKFKIEQLKKTINEQTKSRLRKRPYHRDNKKDREELAAYTEINKMIVIIAKRKEVNSQSSYYSLNKLDEQVASFNKRFPNSKYKIDIDRFYLDYSFIEAMKFSPFDGVSFNPFGGILSKVLHRFKDKKIDIPNADELINERLAFIKNHKTTDTGIQEQILLLAFYRTNDISERYERIVEVLDQIDTTVYRYVDAKKYNHESYQYNRRRFNELRNQTAFNVVMKTDKTNYKKDEPIKLIIEITNHTNQPQELTLYDNQFLLYHHNNHSGMGAKPEFVSCLDKSSLNLSTKTLAAGEIFTQTIIANQGERFWYDDDIGTIDFVTGAKNSLFVSADFYSPNNLLFYIDK